MINKIIVEGPNNVGKSTFINSLLQSPEFEDWSVEHVTSAAPNDFNFYNKTLLNAKNVIFDRHCIGELVYPSLYKRAAKVNLCQVNKLLKKYCENTLIFFIDADYTFIANACKNKNEGFDIDFVTNERNSFNCVYKKLRHHKNVNRIINHIDARYYSEMNMADALTLAKYTYAEELVDEICI